MPVTLSASNRTQLTYKLEGTYPTNFGTLQGSNGTKLNMLSESLDAAFKTESSKTIRSDRQVPDIVQVDLNVQGGFQFEQQYKEFDPFILGALQSSGFSTTFGTNGVLATPINSALTLAAGSITLTTPANAVTTGTDQLSNLKKGQWFMVIPPSGESVSTKAYFASRAFQVSKTTDPTNTVITLETAGGLGIDTTSGVGATGVGTSMLTGAKISSCYASNGTTMKSYSLEVQHTDVAQYRQYLGMIPSKMDLKLSVGSIVTGSFEFMGKGFKLKQATGMGSPSDSQTYTPANATKGVFDILENGASVTAVTYIKSADISIDNNLRMQEAVGVLGTAGIAAGTLVATGKMEVYFADNTLYDKLINNAASSLTIPLLDVDGNGYVFVFPKIRYTAAKLATGGLDQDNMLSMDFQAVLDTSTGLAYSGSTVTIFRVGA